MKGGTTDAAMEIHSLYFRFMGGTTDAAMETLSIHRALWIFFVTPRVVENYVDKIGK